MTQIDRLFRQNQVGFGQFEFNQQVARVFDDMISRSVPLYDDVQRALPGLAKLVASDPLTVIDLGCSTGTSLIHLALAVRDRPMELWGIDNSAAMLEECQKKLEQFEVESKIQLLCTDMESVLRAVAEAQDGQLGSLPRQGAVSMVLLNYTLQFLPADSRLAALASIYRWLEPGGMLVLSEKFCHHEPALDHELVELYCQYKQANGYSATEIARKREALENVLVPWTVEENLQVLKQSGFGKCELLLKWFNFGTIVARK